MLKYTILLAAALAATMIIMPAAAQPLGSWVHEVTASAGGGLPAQDRTAASPAAAANWLDGSVANPRSTTGYSLADLNGEHPSVMLAGGLDDDPFALDGRFHNGELFPDRFGTSGDAGYTTNKYAHKALRMPNGDVLVVSLVPRIGSTVDPASGVGWNIGMVRYNAAGVTQPWTHAGSGFTDSNRYYYVFPNKDVFDNNGSFYSIGDVKVDHNWIYVLAKRYTSATNQSYNVRVVKFSLNSGQWWWTDVMAASATSEWGVGMHFYTDQGADKLTVAVGRTLSSGKYETWMLGYNVSNAAALTVDSSFGTNGVQDATPTDCYGTCKPVAMAGSVISPGVTYIAGNWLYGGDDHNGYISNRDKHGAAVHSFGYQGFDDLYFFDAPDEVATDNVRDIVVGTDMSGGSDRIYVLATVDNNCSTTSAGVTKLTPNGSYDTTFGNGGQLLFGGDGTLPPNCTAFSSITPQAMALNGNRLAVVGFSTFNFFGQWGGGPNLSMIDKDIGYVSDYRVLTPTGVAIGDNGGNGNSTFYSVVASDADSFYAVGRAKDIYNHLKYMPITARLRADRIFGDGME